MNFLISVTALSVTSRLIAGTFVLAPGVPVGTVCVDISFILPNKISLVSFPAQSIGCLEIVKLPVKFAVFSLLSFAQNDKFGFHGLNRDITRNLFSYAPERNGLSG